ADGWLVPRRRASLSALVLRINTFLERNGWAIDRQGFADEAVQREIERKRSFQRTREKATAFRHGETPLSIADVNAALRSVGWLEEGRTLLPHQEQGLLHGLTAVNAANFSVPGSGKTATTLAILATHLASGTIDVIVVVGPLACFRPWERESRIALEGNIATI